ncbi:MAG: hypothetical protein QGG67_06590 [Gammaproteobacteria bacterium]|jgi:hypothetical protein|nr:hypothetical protein [Gammaproteobacteria bacterium]HJO12375.1 hypothetical protein [Gammaproteobacteria bacterium]
MINQPGRIKLTTFLFLFFVSIPALTTAQTRAPVDVHSLGPQVGERVPDFSLPDQNGRTQTLESVMGPNGAMLLFHRSADW